MRPPGWIFLTLCTNTLRIWAQLPLEALLTRHSCRQRMSASHRLVPRSWLGPLEVLGSTNRIAVGADQAMRKRIVGFTILAFLLLATLLAQAQKTLTATEAKDHIGEKATVCGKVVSTRWAESSRGSPTFLNFDEPYPDQVFTLVIWGSDRSRFSEPETTYRGKRVCVTGKISAFKGVPEVVATEPSQIKAQ